MKISKQGGFAHLVALLLVVVGIGVAGSLYVLVSHADKPATAPTNPETAKTTGNGAPNGAHFNLNVIGVPKDKTATITSGNRIFVPLEGSCKVNLSAGEFGVQDGNCSDGSPAAFQLPSPAYEEVVYTVWVRPLGKPDGKAKATTCAADKTGEEVCSVETTAVVRKNGQSTFENVSGHFLDIRYDNDGDAATPAQYMSIFDDRLKGYLWNYDNEGLKLLQVRFYMM